MKKIPAKIYLVAFLILVFAAIAWPEGKELRYRYLLHQYQSALQPGMKRAEAEDWLDAHKIEFGQSDSMDSVSLGNQGYTFGCGAIRVFVNLEYQMWEDRPAGDDQLRAVNLSRQPVECK